MRARSWRTSSSRHATASERSPLLLMWAISLVMRFIEPAVLEEDDMLAGSYVGMVFKGQGRGELWASRPEETLPKWVFALW